MTIGQSIASICVAATLAMPFGTVAESAEMLRMSSWVPPVHPLYTEVLAPWAESIEKVTDGRVKVQILPKSVGSPSQQYDVVTTGQADIVYSNQAYSGARFINYGFAEMPRIGDDAVATSVAYWRVYNRFMTEQDEMADVKLLGLFTHGPGQIFTKGHTITGMTGNGGIKIRGGGVSSTRVIDALGMTAIQAPISKAAEMLSNGIVDGIALEASGVVAFKFVKYLDNRFTVPGGLYNASFFVAMNLDKWNALSPKDRAAIDAISGEALARKAGEMWNSITNPVYATLDGMGYTTSMPEGAFAAELNKIFDGFEQEWIDAVAKNGIDGRAVIDAYRAEIAEYASE